MIPPPADRSALLVTDSAERCVRGGYSTPLMDSPARRASRLAAGHRQVVGLGWCAPLADGVDVTGEVWTGRRVTVVGAGRSGTAAARLLRRLGCRVRVTDAGDTRELRAARAALEAAGVESVELGGHTRRTVEEAQALILSPGVPEASPPIRWAAAAGLPILSEVELAFRFCPSPIVAVTGTNGKSTTVTLIAHLLTLSRRPAVACGNLGLPFSAVVDRLTPQAVAVVEVSSFQLGWCDQFRPKISVLLNLGTNHLDRHHSAQSYLAAKARIFARQTPEDYAVLNGRDPRVAALGERLPVQRIWFGDNRTNPPAYRLAPETMRRLGDGAQAVLQVARLLGIPDPLAWQGIRSFAGLEHRLEAVGAHGGVRFVNDSKSTTPESLLFALRQTPGPVVLIVGGRNKGLDLSPLAGAFADPRVAGLVLLGETRPALRPLCPPALPLREAASLDAAVEEAAALAAPGATVLFSPACASFDMFRDFEERGRTFKAIVGRIISRGRTG
jgi:UDP-N-acetylmuramoylalanine--D-glutamate ligase